MVEVQELKCIVAEQQSAAAKRDQQQPRRSEQLPSAPALGAKPSPEPRKSLFDTIFKVPVCAVLHLLVHPMAMHYGYGLFDLADYTVSEYLNILYI